jgi:hypothetical protein
MEDRQRASATGAAVSDGARHAPSRRAVYRAAAIAFGINLLLCTAIALDGPDPAACVLWSLATNSFIAIVGLAISVLLDAWRGRTGRDSWLVVIALAVAGAVLAMFGGQIIAPWFPPYSLVPNQPGPGVAEWAQFLVQTSVLLLVWSLLHLSIRSGERALAQERRIAAVREAMLADEHKALLYRLNPVLIGAALTQVADGLKRDAPVTAGQTVIALAEQMRSAVQTRSPGAGPPPEAPVVGLDPTPLPERMRAPYDEAKARRRFLILTSLGWLGLLGLNILGGIDERHGMIWYLRLFGIQPVLGWVWCLVMERRLGGRAGQPLKRLYVEAAVLCLSGLFGMTVILCISGAIAGGWARPLSDVVTFESCFIAPALLAWTAAYFLADASRRELARLRATADIREAALKARNALLRQQVNPHFLFNALNALYTLILDSERERALGVIGAIQRFIERALDPAHGELVPLSSELAAQDAYLDIERVRFGGRLLVEHSVAAEVHAARVPHLILQPLVENAVKYGVARTDAPVKVEITAARSGEELVLQVKDTGAPEAAPRPPGLGVGLKNVEGRLRSLYGDAGRLACSPLAPAGFLAEVRLPLVF